MADDVICDLPLEEIERKLQCEESTPTGFSVKLTDASLLVYILSLQNDGKPIITASITLKTDHTLLVLLNSVVIPMTQYQDLCSHNTVQHLSQLINLMARIKAWTEESQSIPSDTNITIAVDLLQQALDELDDSSDEHRRLGFIVEQLQLMRKAKYARSYSPQLLIMSYRLHAASSAGYTVLLDENVVCLPSLSTLKKVTRRLSCTTGLNNHAYLKLRISKLNQFDTNVLLMIDEIYIAKRVEYARGEVQGLTADGEVASTLLCFMIKSITSKYRDLVAMYPMTKLTAEKLNDCFNEVLAQLHCVSFNVVAISVDNAAANRKFFINCLCQGELMTHITNPLTQQPIFLIFDPVHDLKNVYNNFQARKYFECPALHRNLPNGCNANFNDIVQLYDLESTMSLKKAHRLSAASLNPKSIEKTSVKLATSVISESTRDALRYYALHDNKASWSGTADFLALIIKLWNVMNVKTSTKGKHKRDYTMDPIRSSMDWKLDFLREVAEFLTRWEQSQKPGLTRETFLALRQTCLSLADCASYLLDSLGFKYVLLGQLQSDDIESRFGWLRQLAGANYFISMRQVLEGDKKFAQFPCFGFQDFRSRTLTRPLNQTLHRILTTTTPLTT